MADLLWGLMYAPRGETVNYGQLAVVTVIQLVIITLIAVAVVKVLAGTRGHR